MSTVVAPPFLPASPVVSARPTGRRIVGIDLARGLALVAMCTQHVTIEGPDGGESSGWVAWLFRESAGRASVVFFVLAGVSLALITAGGSSSAEPKALRRRGVALTGIGLALTGTIWEASILQHYGVAFLLAPWLIRAARRTLAVIAAAGLLLGPVALLGVWSVDEEVTGAADGTLLDPVIETVWDIVATGYYPMIVWIGFFACGLLVGRLDLRRASVIGWLAAVGVIVAVAADLVVGALGGPAEMGAAQLLDTTGHSGMIGWTVQTGGMALAAIAAALALPTAVSRRLGPVVTTGSMSLSAYLLHIALVAGVFSFGVAPLGWSVGAQEAAFLGLVTAMIATCVALGRWHRVGPAERVMKRIATPRQGSFEPEPGSAVR
ncbi:MAG: heparan-alpha-glucosaminide N-acetyltransferase domain-containing protein [Actinomycetota bacterium]